MILFLVIIFSLLSTITIVYFTEINWWLSLPIFIGNLILFVMLFLLSWYLHALTVKKDSEILRPKKYFNFMTREICKLVCSVCGIKIIKEGFEKIESSKMLLVCNHQSNFDPLVIIPALKNMGLTFIMKESLLKLPVIGRYVTSAGFFSLNRENNREGLKTIIKCIKRVEEGFPVGVFPEGTRSKDKEIAELKDGAFKIATRAKSDVAIFIIDNAYKVRKRIPFRRTKVLVKVCEVLKYDDIKDLSTSEISEISSKIMKKELADAREKYAWLK